MTPSVSVIIPTYNRWPMLCDAIESVIGQSYKGFELIVVDDGSNDGTVEKLSRYGPSLSACHLPDQQAGAQAGVRVLSQPRRGVAAARNLGVRWSGGRYLAFLDSDDLWQPRKLETQMAFMEVHTGVQICQTGELWIRDGTRVNPKKRHHKPSGDIFRASLDLCVVSPSAVMMTRELFERVGEFDESFTVCEDYDLWLRVAVETPVFLVPDPLVLKRGGHEGQLSCSTWGLDRFRILALRKLLRSGLRGEKGRWTVEALAKKVAILTRGARKRGKEDEALHYEGILSQALQEMNHVESENSRLRETEGVSRADSGTLV